MAKYFSPISACLVIFSLSGCGPKEFLGLNAADLFPNINDHTKLREAKTLVSNPANEVQAVISPDGQKLVYVSDEQGNCDIFIRPLKGGQAKQLTVSSADDLEPNISPDGKFIAYVSMINDAKGDIWIMQVNGKGARKLSERDSADSNPVFSPDGRYLYYVARYNSANRDKNGIYRIDLSTGQNEFVRPGYDPIPLNNSRLLFADLDENNRMRLMLGFTDGRKEAIPATDGRYLEGFPQRAISGDGREFIIFSRFCDDTNGDGQIDGDDNPSLWRLNIADKENDSKSNVYPLTNGEFSEIYGKTFGDLLIFTATVFESSTRVLPLDGTVPENIADEALYQLATGTDNLATRKMLLRYLVSRGGKWAAYAHYQLSQIFESEGLLDATLQELLLARQEVADDPDLAKMLDYESYRVETEYQMLWQSKDKNSTYLAERLKALQKEEDSLDSYSERVRARYWTTWARLSTLAGNRRQVYKKLNVIIGKIAFSSEDEARAKRMMADMAWQVNQEEQARQLELELLQIKSPLPIYKEQAVKQLIKHIPDGVSTADYLYGLSRLENLPLLAAQSLLALGDFYQEQKQDSLAKEVYLEILDRYPRQDDVVVIALEKVAAITAANGQNSEAIGYWQQIITSCNNYPHAQRKAREAIASQALEKAINTENNYDLEEAYKLYGNIIEANGEAVIAHRHYIALAAKFGRLNEIAPFYERALQENPEAAHYLYGKGLLLTYLGPQYYSQAEKLIKKALDKNPRLAEAMLTLGWIEEQYYHQKFRSDHLEKAVDYYNGALNDAKHQETIRAALLDLGNVFFLMGKDSLAYSHYSEYYSLIPSFDSFDQQMVFYERFARVAIRLDKNEQADILLNPDLMPLNSHEYRRYGEILLLRAMNAYAQENYSLAVAYYKESAEYFKNNRNTNKMITALRAAAMAADLSNNLEESQRLTEKAIDAITQYGNYRLHRRGFLEFEVEMDPGNVTRAPYGFDKNGEEEILSWQMSKNLLRQGRVKEAYDYYQRKVSLLTDFAKNSHKNEAVGYELIYTYYNLGRLALSMKNYDQAREAWDKALTIDQHSVPSLLKIEDKLVLMDNLLDLERYDYSLPPVYKTKIQSYLQELELNCQNSNLAPHCIKTYLRMGAIALRDGSKLDSVPETINVESLQNLLDDHIRYIKEGKLWAEKSFLLLSESDLAPNLQAAVYALLAHGYALEGQLITARDWAEKAQTTADEKLLWRLLYDRASWDFEQRGELLTSALNELLSHRQNLSYTADNSREFRSFIIDIWSEYSKTGQEKQLLELADFWRSRQLDDPTGPFVQPAKLAGLLGQGAYLFQQDMAGKRLLLLFTKDKTFSYYGAAAQAADWLTPLLNGLTAIYVDSLNDPAWLEAPLTEWRQSGRVSFIPRPALLQKALENQSFADQKPLYIGPQKGRDSLVAISDLSQLKRNDGSAFASWLLFDYPVVSGLKTVPLMQTEAHHWQPLKIKEWPAQLLIFNNYSSEPLLKIKNSEDLSGDIDADRLSRVRLVSEALNNGATQVVLEQYPIEQLVDLLEKNKAQMSSDPELIALKDLTSWTNRYGSLGLTEKERQAVAKKDYKNSAAAAVVNYQKSQWDKAITPFARSIVAMEFIGRETTSYRSFLAESYFNNGNFEAAFNEQKRVREDFINSKQSLMAAQAGLALGKMYYNSGYYEQAGQIFTTVAQEYLELNEKASAADSFSRAGTAQSNCGNYKAAQEGYHQALEIYSELGDEQQYNVRRYLGIILENKFNDYEGAGEYYQSVYEYLSKKDDHRATVTALLDIVRTKRGLGQFIEAFKLLTKAQKTVDKNDEQGKGEIQLERARLYWYQGDYLKALATNREVLALAKKLDNVFLTIQTISLQGLIQRNQGNYQAATESLQLALDLARKSGRRSEIASQLNNLGIVYRDQKLLAEAEAMFTEALAIDKELHNREGLAFDKRNLALTFMEYGLDDQAENLLKESLNESQEMALKYNEVECSYALAGLYAKTGRPNEARSLFEKTSGLAHKLNTSDIEWRTLFALAEMDIKDGEKARAEKRLLSASKLVFKIDKAGNNDLAPNKRDLYGLLIDLLMEKKAYTKALKQLVNYHQSRSDDFMGTSQKLKNNDKLSIDFLSEDSALLVAFPTPDNLALWWWDKDGLTGTLQPVSRNDLNKVLDVLSKKMEYAAPVDRELSQLGEWVLAPFGERLDKVRKLAFIPSGSLAVIPQTALIYQGRNFLQRDILTWQVPTKALTGASKNYEPVIFDKDSYIVIGGNGTEETPFTKLENRAIYLEHGTQNNISLKTPVNSGMAAADILHLSGHTIINNQDPLSTMLKIGDDSYVSLKNMIDNQQLPSLMVLSSCQLTDPPQHALQSFSQAVLTGRTKAVIMSNGRVNDLASALLMKYFYRYLLDEKMTPEKALFEAQKELSGKYPHPTYWGRFILISTVQ